VNDGLMEQLLHEGETSCLDYKRDQYPFAGATDDEKGELLKDILAFANGWRHAEAYILIGVEEVAGGRSTVVRVSHHIPENDLQQFVNSKTNRPVMFSYRSYPFEGKQVGVITIPQQDRPLYLNKNYGRLKKHVVYYRQGTTTATAGPITLCAMANASKTGPFSFRAMSGGDWSMMRSLVQESTRSRSRYRDEMYSRFAGNSFSGEIRQGHIALMRTILPRRAPNLLSSHQLSSIPCPRICIRISSEL